MPPEGDWACRKRKTYQKACLLKGIGHAESGKHIKKHAFRREPGMQMMEKASKSMLAGRDMACRTGVEYKRACSCRQSEHA